jgi:predicted Zn-dependent protease
MLRLWSRKDKSDRETGTLLKKVQQDPENRALLLEVVDHYEQTRSYETTLSHLEKLIALEPAEPDYCRRTGVILRKLQRPEEALAMFKEASRLAPDDQEVQVNQMKCLLDLGRSEEAEKKVRHLLSKHPKQPMSQYAYGLFLKNQGKTNEAIEAFRRTLELDGSFARAHTNLGLLYDKSGDKERAVTHFRRAIRLEPERPE